MKIIILAHGHPRLQKGGGEVAAYSWFKLLQSRGFSVIFVGRGERSDQSHSKTVLHEIDKDEYIIYTSTEFFNFSTQNNKLRQALELLIRVYSPDVFHLHHFVHLGIEAASLIKRLAPKTKIILTLHEYLAICHNNGQLLTTSGSVCDGYSPDKCFQCFPELSINAFFMRELAIKAALSYFDHFICPSQFLFDRYIKWGLPSDKVSVIENPFPIPAYPPNQPIRFPELNQPLKIGFFGQINFYKGLDIIIDGIKLVVQDGVNVELGIHGKMSHVTGSQYVESLLDSIRECREFISFYGAYESTEALALMSQYHFIIMGSRWFENSPVVIQEALEANRPLIVPSFGGMLEKVKDIGLTYISSNPTSLRKLLFDLTAEVYLDLVVNVECRRSSLGGVRVGHQNAVLNIYGVS